MISDRCRSGSTCFGNTVIVCLSEVDEVINTERSSAVDATAAVVSARSPTDRVAASTWLSALKALRA
jgi:hypothetical protein